MSRATHRAPTIVTSRRRRIAGLLALMTTALLIGMSIQAVAATITSATFSGGTGTVTVGGTVYAKQGGALTLTVVTSNDIQCVDVAGAVNLPRQTAAAGKTSWVFTTTAPAGNGAQAFTVTASEKFNNNNCSGQTNSTQASYVLDNTGPVVTPALTPAANTAGWNNDNVIVKWTATDAGSGVVAAQPFKTENVSANGITTVTAPAQSDRLGNTGAAGSVTVRIDKAPPTITATQTKNANGTVTVTFTCGDSISGIASCVADGQASNSRTVTPGTNSITVGGTATDAAGNTATASVVVAPSDTTGPVLTSAPTTEPNANGWYKGDVTIDWTASDAESGVPTQPADTTIAGEGAALTSTQTATNGVGLSTTATSAPVKIDRTAPITGISGTSNNWVNGNVTVALAATDNLSTVAKTEFTVDGGGAQTGTSSTLSADGDHTITYWSTDKAGNTEAAQTAHVKIDQTAPTIGHTFTPLAYTDGAWTNQNVTVTFTCLDQGGSGVAGCTAPVTKTTEGANQQVVGTATDGAGNSATDTALVSIDKSAPTISAAADRAANGAGWYDDDVTVSFTANDALSGIASSPAPRTFGEGANQSASGTAIDAAGNSTSASVTGINVDKTNPVLTGSFASGWHKGDVVVTWTCTDTLSGVASAPANETVTGAGDNLSSTASCIDKAGNTTTETVSGITIDRTAPVTLASASGTVVNGWYSADVDVTLDAIDSLSGVAATYYTVDGGTPKAYTVPFSLGEGEHTVVFWSEDNAGNIEDESVNSLTVSVDKTAPSTRVINPISPDSGWFVTSGIPFAFAAEDAGSGVAATYYTIDGGDAQTYGEPFTTDLSTGKHTVAYWSVDIAGNAETKGSFEVKVDTVAPSIEGHQTPAANLFGWNNTNVDVTFTCSDDDSGVAGIAGCAGDTTLANNGAGQAVTGDAVDVAGNRSSTTYGPVNIDKVPPTLAGVPTTDANAASWYKGDVVVKWVGDDGVSGINPATQPANSTITGEGSNLGAGPVSIEDKAGNSVSASVTDIKIDRTAPVVTGGPTTQPNAAGWYQGEVVVDFQCSDALSGVAVCPTSKLVKADGANQSVTSDNATDNAGNTAAKTVSGISIDGTAPNTTSNNTCTAVNDWCKGDTADVVLTATDQTGLSGVKEIHYVVDGGAEQTATGASTTVSVPLSGSGAGTVKYWAVDKAGNVETANSIALKWDNIAPTVSHSLSPAPNADEWNNSDVTVTFTAKDDDKGSGVASVTAPVKVTTETAGQVVTGTAKDTADNVGTDSVTVKLDRTAPTITGAITSGTLGANGWYVGPVTVTFTCSDALSGVATCPDPATLSANGAGQSASGTATDKAGNTRTVTVSGINIDQEKPTLTTADINVQGQTYVVGAVPTATCTASDSFSGLASCTVTVTSPANAVGVIGYTAVAKDKAGNTTTLSGTYSIKYRFDGFLQPINDTAHQVGTSTSIFKAGSTVPAKFAVRRADGTAIQLATAPVWLTPVKGSAMTAPVDETVYTASVDSGTTYKYDATAQQYIYNWKTGTGGNYYRIGVKFDDGQTYYVNIGLR
jgi:hypothetical protein